MENNRSIMLLIVKGFILHVHIKSACTCYVAMLHMNNKFYTQQENTMATMI